MKKGIGARTVKTAIAVGLALLVKLILVLAIDTPTGQPWSKIVYTPFFGAIAAAYSMHMDRSSSEKQAKIRTMGSLVGGLYGMVILILCQMILNHGLGMKGSEWYYYLVDYTVVAIAIIPMIHLTVVTKKTYATWIACLTYLSVTVSIRNDFDDQLAGVFSSNAAINGYVIAMVFAGNRILSTIIGVAISLGVNMFKLPKKTKNKDILFCVGIEGLLGADGDKMVGYTNYQMNHMVESGANCTLFTTRVPRTFMHLFGNVKINNPVVCMSGAALYDPKSLTYLDSEPIPLEVTKKIDSILDGLNITPFKNYIHDDLLHVYTESLDNKGEELMAAKMKNAAYGNFTIGKCPFESDCLFYLMIEDKSRIEEIKKALLTDELNEKIIIQEYDYFDNDSKLVPELAYVKIYSKKILELNVLHKYAKEKNYRVVGLTTSKMAEHLLDNSEIKVTSTDYNGDGTIKIDTYEDMFKKISKIYYGKKYRREEVSKNE